MNTLKVTAHLECDICGCKMKRTRSFYVKAEVGKEMIAEARSQIDTWKESLKGTMCKVCKSIVDGVNG